MPLQLLSTDLPSMQTLLLILGGFYLLTGLWLSLAPRLFKAPTLVVISVELLPLERSFSLEHNRSRWQRLFQMIGYLCLALCVLSWAAAFSL